MGVGGECEKEKPGLSDCLTQSKINLTRIVFIQRSEVPEQILG